MNRNRKVEILDLLSDGRWWSAPEVAHQLGLTLTNASECLRRYWRGGLVSRRRVETPYNPPRLFEYRINKYGLRRLEFLKRVLAVQRDDDERIRPRLRE